MSRKLTILGAGESGVGAALLAKKEGWEVFVSDSEKIQDAFKNELIENQIRFEEQGHTNDLILEADEIVKSPGIPSDALIVKIAKKSGISILSEIEFAYRYTSASIIAITGTNGKTTTTLLTHHLMKEAGINVGLAGNIGDSFARKVATEQRDWYVLEISSFQLDDIHAFRPKIATVLNITPDHLDRYDFDLDKYASAKFQITKNMSSSDLFVYNADDELVCRELNKLRKSHFRTEPFSLSFLKNNELEIPALNQLAVDLEGFDEPLNMHFDHLPLKGKHNAMNMSAAILMALRAGADEFKIKKALPSFKNTAHRMEMVAVIHGIPFYNDSKGTNVEAAKYALDSFDQPIIWIAGGQDKGNDYSQLLPWVRKNVKAMICLGVDNTKLTDAFGETVPYHIETQSVSEAVLAGYHFAEKGDVVLLSPACASFDLFQNYAARGDQFREAVSKLNNELQVNIKP